MNEHRFSQTLNLWKPAYFSLIISTSPEPPDNNPANSPQPQKKYLLFSQDKGKAMFTHILSFPGLNMTGEGFHNSLSLSSSAN